jgi:hypothetical protein
MAAAYARHDAAPTDRLRQMVKAYGNSTVNDAVWADVLFSGDFYRALTLTDG